ncbi:MAG: methylmalonyl-CoA epimerase [Planctomycetes bacterium]|nr:methylmalonyl-CoA epimerase [Planctomycetota bacterium]MBI3844326.1 methylmalonyl-CoA epimerase [Planctomycetota bacterium]
MQGLEHVAIAVLDLDAAIANFRDGLGLKLLEVEDVPSQKTRVAKFALGKVTIELVSPTSPDSALAKSIQKRGEGLHHLAIRVDALVPELRALALRGVELVDREPKPGSSGTKIAFLHPRSLGGVLVELVERGGDERRGA